MERFIVSNNPLEPTQPESHGSNEPTYIQQPPPYEVSGSQMPTYPPSTANVPPPPPYETANPYSYQPSSSYPPPPPYEPASSHMPPPRKDQKKNSRLFMLLAIIVIVVIVAGGLSWFLTRPKTTSSTPVTTTVAKGQVSFLDSQNKTPGATDALKIAATGLSNPPDGSEYDAWLIDTTSEQIIPLGSFSKSNPTTFALSFSSTSGQSQTNLVGAGNKVEITQEQEKVTAPAGKVLLSATFPPLALVHIRHLLFKFPTTPGNIGLLTGLLNETQKVNRLSQMLQNNTTNTASVSCIAQAIVNVIEGKNGKNFSPLAANCASVGIGNALTGDGFGILGNGYIATASGHAALAASQSDATDTIRRFAKDVEKSTDSVKEVITKIDNDAVQLLSNPATTTQISEMVSLADHAYDGFDQDGNGKIEPVVGEAGAQTAYTSGQHMATLTLA